MCRRGAFATYFSIHSSMSKFANFLCARIRDWRRPSFSLKLRSIVAAPAGLVVQVSNQTKCFGKLEANLRPSQVGEVLYVLFASRVGKGLERALERIQRLQLCVEGRRDVEKAVRPEPFTQ